MDNTLFDIEEYTDPDLVRIMSGHTCRGCANRFDAGRGHFYCSATKSKLTKSGFLRVRTNQPACILFTHKSNPK